MAAATTFIICTLRTIPRSPVGEDFSSTSGLINMRISFLMGCWAENIRRLSSKGDTCTLKCSNQFSAACMYQQLNYHSQADSIFVGAERDFKPSATNSILLLLKLWVCICVAVPKQLLAPSLRTCGVKLRKLFPSIYFQRGGGLTQEYGVTSSYVQGEGAQMLCCTGRCSRNHPQAFLHMSGGWGAET